MQTEQPVEAARELDSTSDMTMEEILILAQKRHGSRWPKPLLNWDHEHGGRKWQSGCITSMLVQPLSDASRITSTSPS
ncbi:MAG: hypothetical protein JWN75_13 [Candidatus Saccharibacteria bacterium]|jgi:hypothetical protein|nr:hypothetical protein [Candidatus Saccharibacteria bacterium]